MMSIIIVLNMCNFVLVPREILGMNGKKTYDYGMNVPAAIPI